MNDVPPRDRDVAMVFQSYALYPHMTVAENIRYALKLRKIPKPEVARRSKKPLRSSDSPSGSARSRPDCLGGIR